MLYVTVDLPNVVLSGVAVLYEDLPYELVAVLYEDLPNVELSWVAVLYVTVDLPYFELSGIAVLYEHLPYVELSGVAVLYVTVNLPYVELSGIAVLYAGVLFLTTTVHILGLTLIIITVCTITTTYRAIICK